MPIAHMGPAAYPLGPVIVLVALRRALRRVGATADVGAAVEAALGEDPIANEAYPEFGGAQKAAQTGIGRLVMRQDPNDYEK